MFESKHLTVISALVWAVSSEQQYQSTTSMIIDKYRVDTYLQTFQKGNEEAINTIFIQFYLK